MKLRSMNPSGLEAFEHYLQDLKATPNAAVPTELLSKPGASEPSQVDADFRSMSFRNRFEAGKYIFRVLDDAAPGTLLQDAGAWAWLSLFYFDAVCPADAQGQRRPGELARYVPDNTNYRKYYRHLLAGPYRIFRAHKDKPERALALLCTPVHKPGDLAEQLAARQELITNAAALEAATKLFVDPQKTSPRRGAAGRGPGSARRYAELLNQFDVTWDLYAMESMSIIALLPKEFERFRSVAAALPTPKRH